MPVLVTNKVTKRYRMGEVSVTALDRVDFQVEKGEFVAIMGPSGSGKSTLLHLLGGLDGSSDGEVTLAGKPLSRLSDNEVTLVRRRNVGFIFQFYNLVPTLSAEENIALPLLIDGQKIEDHRRRIDELLNLVGLTERRHHKPDQMSGGQQQRVAVARALATDPAIILADEPTGNLDSKSGTAILDLLRHTCDDLGHTIVMVTHDARAASYADRVVFLQDGHIVHELHRTDNDRQHTMEAIIDVMRQLD
ncbi:MAG TPA: ABC transporter ATP-binding protein [Anaerolineae bacterium]